MDTASAANTNDEPVQIIVLLREQQIAVQLHKAFGERYLPEHLFYWLPDSVQAWFELCRSIEYRNASRALEVLTVAAAVIAGDSAHFKTLCSFGCGEGSKEHVILQAFAGTGNRLDFIGADYSQALLELALDSNSEGADSRTGIKLNVLDDFHLQAAITMAHSTEGPALFSVLGNTLGSFDPKRFPRRLRECCYQADGFLFDGEIFTESTLVGYDNPTNRRFAWGPLTGVGITEDDGRLEFATESAGDGLFAVTKHFIASRDLRVNLGGEVIEIHAGEKLRMSSSIKYRTESVLMAFVESAGFEVTGKWLSKDSSFVLGYAKPTANTKVTMS